MPNYLNLFRNIYKKTDKHPDLRGFIKIEEALEPGDYEVGLYEKMKDGKKSYSGTIRKQLPKPVKHWEDGND